MMLDAAVRSTQVSEEYMKAESKGVEMSFIDTIKERAKQDLKTIVLPESEDIRTYKAAEQVLKEGFAKVIIIGSEEEVAANKADCDITGAVIVDPAKSDKTEAYVQKFAELRAKKGMTVEGQRDHAQSVYVLRRYDGQDGRC